MSNQEDFGRPEKPLEIKRKIDNETGISKKTKMKKKKINRNLKQIILCDIQLSSLIIEYPHKISFLDILAFTINFPNITLTFSTSGDKYNIGFI